MKSRKKSWRNTRRGGSTLVEFAMVVPVLFALLIGIMEFGWLVKGNMQVANAAREGARTASLGNSTTGIKAVVSSKASPMTVTTTIQHSTDGGTTYTTTGDSSGYNNAISGAMIRVTVQTRYRPLTGLFPFLKNRNITAKAEFGRE